MAELIDLQQLVSCQALEVKNLLGQVNFFDVVCGHLLRLQPRLSVMIVHQILGITHKQRFKMIRMTGLLAVMPVVLEMEFRGVGLRESITLVDSVSCQGTLLNNPWLQPSTLISR
jgi:hypothetical protein